MRQSFICFVLAAIVAATAAKMYAAGPRIHTTADAPWDSGTYLYDGSGNIRAIDTDRYVYDAAGRLRSGTVRGPQHRQDYVYDAFGNRIASTTTPPAPCAGGVDCDESITVDPLTNRIISGAATYDEAGNVTSLGNSHSTYVYDATRMLAQQTDGANVRQYVYTADDQRIAVYSNHEWLWTVRDPAQRVVREFSSHDGGTPWAINRDYVYSDTALLGTFSGAGRRHMHRDHLGTPRLVTDDNGRRLAEHDYYPFGAEVQLTAESPEERMKFTGHERDTITGEIHTLDYMHARYYIASMGRFLSVDPKERRRPVPDPQRWNRYAYASNSPVLRFDPDGQDDFIVFRPENAQTGADAEWRRLAIQARRHHNTLTIYNGAAATTERYTRALATPNAHVIAAGHAVESSQGGPTVSALMSNGAVGPLPYAGLAVSVPDVRASTVAVFACNSVDLQSQYAPATFTGVSSGANGTTLHALDESALAYTKAAVQNRSVTDATTAASTALAENHDPRNSTDQVVTTPASNPR